MTTMRRNDIIIEFTEGWNIIHNGILRLVGILNLTDVRDGFPVSEYINIYTTVYKMCIQAPPHCYAQQLYHKYRDPLEEYIVLTVLPALGKVHGEVMLSDLAKHWENYKFMVRAMSNMFSYVDRCFAEKRSLDSLKRVGITCFHDLAYNGIKGNVKNVVLELIKREREGEQIDRILLRNILNIFVEIDMDFYTKDFEGALLEDTGAYYSRRGALWISELTCPDYMLNAEECLRREKERAAHYLQSSTGQKLLEKVQNELLSRYQTQLLENEYSGCHALLRDEKKDDLSTMYRLFCRIPEGLEMVTNMFKEHVISQGITLFKWAENAVNNNEDRGDIELELVEKIIELHDKSLDYVVNVFQKSNIFHKALRKAFEIICNKRPVGESTSAELLATFCHNVIKRGAIVKISDDGIESILEKAANLLQYVSDKDLFCKFYSSKLANRLLSDKSADASNERTILLKIRNQFGSLLTSKMERMVKDFTLARETQADFQKYLDAVSNRHPPIEFAVTVLTNGCWPTYKPSEINLPSEMLKCIEVYKCFYSIKYQHRKLTWIYCLGNCKIIGKFDSKSIEIRASTNQAVMLLLFNNSERLSYEDIKSQINLPEEDVISLLHSIVCGKYKIIVKEPISNTISKTDTFEFNRSFTCKSTRIKLPFPQMDEKKKIREVVDSDRRDAIDAAIVRTMKIRKVLTSQELFGECLQQLQAYFKLNFNTMKQRILNLISKEFLELENGNIIRYLA